MKPTSRSLMLAVFILALAQLACQPELSENPLWARPGTAGQTIPTPTPLPQAEVTFSVQIPPDTPQDGSTITLTLLDEVSGLSLNPRRVPMEAMGSNLYQAQVSLTVGAVIKYRYERLLPGGAIVEFRSDGLPVRYRLLRVDGPMTVYDQMARWDDTAYNGPAGRIQGQVADPQGRPIPDVLVTAAGHHTLTAANGRFILDGLPPGTHNLVAYHLDQTFTVYQQLAQVAPDAATPADIVLSPRPLVPVAFTVTIPETRPRNPPLRLVGNLYRLGNTFGDLEGGLSTMGLRAPLLQPVGDRRYALTLNLPVGAYIRYNYTLGDGYWNAERDNEGHFVIRELIVPEGGTQVDDTVSAWNTPHVGPIWFEVVPPANTPPGDTITLQLNPVVWTAPLPMWPLGDGRWGYLFYGPLSGDQELHYRYCRNGACAAAGEPNDYGRLLVSSPLPQTIKDTVEAWRWYAPPTEETVILAAEPQARPADFIYGVALSPAYTPYWPSMMNNGLQDIRQHLQARWVFLRPTWSATRVNLPVFEAVPGRDPLWQDLVTMASLAHQADLQTALYPAMRFPTTAAEWWAQAARTFGWWNSWFDRYREMALHFADAAAATGAQALVLGGSWVSPALPGGLLPDGSPSSVPADAEQRWRALFAEVRTYYAGTIYWAMPFPDTPHQAPNFLDAVDGILLEWQPALTEDPQADEATLEQATGALLDAQVYPLQQTWGKPILLAPAYPATDGGVTGCPRYHDQGCLPLSSLRPGHIPADLAPDLQEQVDAYNALFLSVNARPWVGGLVIREYYPLAALQDPSPSLYGKPAADVVGYWFKTWQSTSP